MKEEEKERGQSRPGHGVGFLYLHITAIKGNEMV
jgi:hypothetical protein